MHRATPHALVGLALLAPPALSQEAAEPGVRYQGGVFELDLPSSWRRLGPGEATRLRDELRFVVAESDAMTLRNQVLGDVDRWLEHGFDGRALIVYSRPFELPTTQETLDGIVAARDGEQLKGGAAQQIVSAQLTEVGPSGHPAIEVQTRIRPGNPEKGAMRTWDYYASTSGQKLILSFRTWENGSIEVEPAFRSMVDSLIFARPPQDPAERGNGILWAAVLGAITGLALLVARFLLKRQAAA